MLLQGTSKFPPILMTVILELTLFQSTSSCGGRTIMNRGVTEHDKQIILDSHNKIRQVIALGQLTNQPPAENMLRLKWSDQLAQRAQHWAETCTSTKHDPGRHLGDYFVGQNIATKWTTARPSTYIDMQPEWIVDAIVEWFNENMLYAFGGFRGASTGHYTQMIWAQTTHVGCGFVFYLDGNKYTKKYVCNYGPSGNVLGESPYHVGYPNCYGYGMIESRIYPGLCDVSTNHASNYYHNNYNNRISNNNGFSHNYNHYINDFSDLDRSNNYFYNLLNHMGYQHK